MPQGTVRWFDAERGFGFIDVGDGGEDLFVHASEILDDDGPRVLREGQTVEYEVGEGSRGPQARSVRVTGDRPADAPLGVLGTVGWYEPTKGYGFITPDDARGEIFVHSSAVVGGGVIAEGQRVAFLVVDGEKGPQADHLLPLGDSAGPAASGRADGADGTVSWYDDLKGFGFIAPDEGGDDVFVHVKALGHGLTGLAEGDRVSYEVVAGDRGPNARNVQVVGGRGSRGSGSRGGSYGSDSRGGGAYGSDSRGGSYGDRGRQGRPSSGAPVRGGEGTVARYDADRGFGFITPDAGGDDLFVHVSVVRGSEPLFEGDRVRFKIRQSDRGPQADGVELI